MWSNVVIKCRLSSRDISLILVLHTMSDTVPVWLHSKVSCVPVSKFNLTILHSLSKTLAVFYFKTQLGWESAWLPHSGVRSHCHLPDSWHIKVTREDQQAFGTHGHRTVSGKITGYNSSMMLQKEPTPRVLYLDPQAAGRE